MKNSKLRNSLMSLTVFVIFFLLSACNSYKELPYLKGSQEGMIKELDVNEPKIMANDIISITVNSYLAGAATDFNLPLVPPNLNNPLQTTVTSSATTGGLQNYVVDKNGRIDFPVLGEILVGGLTIEEAKQYITSLIYPKYISEKPVVSIRFANFKISVLGEVVRPGIYQSETGQMTILDALAAAGDMTIYGKRNNVLLVRIQENGNIEMHRINMQDDDIVLNKDIFYLQQNDKLYIETNKAKGNNSRFGTFESIGISALSIVISVVAIVTRFL